MPMMSKRSAAIGGSAAVLIAAAQFITPWEGVFTRWYYDMVGVPTFCIGQTAADGYKPDFSRTYTKKECEDILAKTLPKQGQLLTQ